MNALTKLILEQDFAQLQKGIPMSLLKETATALGLIPKADKRCKATWACALEAYAIENPEPIIVNTFLPPISLEKLDIRERKLKKLNRELKAENEELKEKVAELEANLEKITNNNDLEVQQQPAEEPLEQDTEEIIEPEALAEEFWDLIVSDRKCWIAAYRNCIPAKKFLAMTPGKDSQLCYEALRIISEEGAIELFYDDGYNNPSFSSSDEAIGSRYFIFSNAENHQSYAKTSEVELILEQLNQITYHDSKGLVSEHLGCLPLSELRQHLPGTCRSQNIALLLWRNEGMISLEYGYSKDSDSIFTDSGKIWSFVQVEELDLEVNLVITEGALL